jgi:hypothetical protein
MTEGSPVPDRCETCGAPAGWPRVSLEYVWTPLLPKVRTHKGRRMRPAAVMTKDDTHD